MLNVVMHMQWLECHKRDSPAGSCHDQQPHVTLCFHKQLERKKKSIMRMRLDEFVGERAEQPSDSYSPDSQQQGAWGRQEYHVQHQVQL
jgi:hypothetical protein